MPSVVASAAARAVLVVVSSAVPSVVPSVVPSAVLWRCVLKQRAAVRCCAPSYCYLWRLSAAMRKQVPHRTRGACRALRRMPRPPHKLQPFNQPQPLSQPQPPRNQPQPFPPLRLQHKLQLPHKPQPPRHLRLPHKLQPPPRQLQRQLRLHQAVLQPFPVC